jgi:predicted ATPase
MELVLAVLGATGVLVAIAANMTSVARFFSERRRPGSGRLASPPPPGRAMGVPPSAAADGTPAVGPRRTTRPPISTPDQRVRVFVSSTLGELAAERVAVRRAIESLRLTPVMFELGARPHPPRDLYRSYLAQSDIFVAIYGARYGWIAPGEQISGLEDEYLLARGLPKLVYVRAAEEPRDDALQRLLERVRVDDEASYTQFDSPAMLAELLANDLALLLSERFALQGRERHAAIGPAMPPATVPRAVTSFVGREALMSALSEAVLRPEVRILTLYGAGGAGKSRLAVELGSRLRDAFADDVRYVSLAAVREPSLVASSLAIGLGVRETVGISAEQALREALAQRSGLLIVDNFEHLVAAAPVISLVTEAAPRLTVLVTSRSVLRLSGEVVFPVPPLDLPPPGVVPPPAAAIEIGAVRLFVERARAVDRHFELDADNVSAVIEVCRRVDALPLAIELAAARVRSLPPKALLARMTKRLPLLVDGPRDAPERQRTLRDAIAWSVDLLDADAQAVFARLSVFDGGASLAMIERVVPFAGDVLPAVASLVDCSLVQRADTEDDRLVMLETVREYAAERFEHDPEADAVRERHARAFLASAEEAARDVRGPDQEQGMAWLRLEIGNLRTAMATFLDAGAGFEAVRLATVVRPLLMACCHYEEGRRLLELALAAGDDVTGSVRADALLAFGAMAWRQGDLAAALPPAEESLEAYRAAGDRAGTAAALRLLGVHAHNAGEYDVAQQRLEEAVRSLRALGDDEGLANTLLSLGNVAFDRAEARAADLYAESRDVAERVGDVLGVAYALDNLGALAWCRGDLSASERFTDDAAAIYGRLDHRFGSASVAHRRGLLAYARSDLAAAERHLTQSLDIRSALGDTRGQAFVEHDLGRVAVATGRMLEARRWLRSGLELATRHGSPLVEVLYLEAVAALVAVEGVHTAALELSAAASAWRRRARVPTCRVNRDRHLTLLRQVRRALGPAGWQEAESVGSALSVEQAVDRARSLLRTTSHVTDAA